MPLFCEGLRTPTYPTEMQPLPNLNLLASLSAWMQLQKISHNLKMTWVTNLLSHMPATLSTIILLIIQLCPPVTAIA